MKKRIGFEVEHLQKVAKARSTSAKPSATSEIERLDDIDERCWKLSAELNALLYVVRCSLLAQSGVQQMYVRDLLEGAIEKLTAKPLSGDGKSVIEDAVKVLGAYVKILNTELKE